MSTIDKLDNLGLPEKTARVELIINPLNELKASYDAWCNIAEQVVQNNLGLDKELMIAKRLYEEALNLAGSKIKGIKSYEVMHVLHRKAKFLQFWSGTYMTALLNNSCCDELAVEGFDLPLSFVGYGLSRGKIIIKAGYDNIGYKATGGIIVNYGNIEGSMGIGASGGVFVNNGKILGYMDDGMGPLYPSGSLGGNASGGVFLNNGTVRYMAFRSKGGTFIAKKKPEESFMEEAELDAIGIKDTDLEKDIELSMLVNILLKSVETQGYDELKQLASQIESHCSGKYKK